MIARFLESEGFWLFRRSPFAIIAALVTLVIVGSTLLAPWIAPTDPYDLASFGLQDAFLPPVWLDGGSSSFLLGTDDQGRDMLSSVLYGSRLSLLVAGVAMLAALLVGVAVGLCAAYFGGVFDATVMRIADVQLALPAILTALLIDGISRGILPKDMHDRLQIWVITTAIAMSLWVNFARTARASAMVEQQKSYVEAAMIMGQSRFRIMFSHILPNILGPLFVIATVDLASAILLEATLSFLGVGLSPSSPSLGTLIRTGMQYLLSGEWWILWIPTSFLIVLVIAINLLGDFLRDLLNPRLR